MVSWRFTDYVRAYRTKLRQSVKTDHLIAFGDLSLLANGGAIVEGNLRIVTGAPLAPALEPPTGAVLVRARSPYLDRQPISLAISNCPVSTSISIPTAHFFTLGSATAS